MTARRALVAAIVFAALLMGSIAELTRRVLAHLREHPTVMPTFIEVDSRGFTFAGRPVSLTDVDDRGVPTLVVRYGDRELRLRVTIPTRHEALKDIGLAAHRDWFRVLRFVETSGIASEEVEARVARGELTDRLVLVTRTPRQGVDPETWGQVWKRDWVFDFYELKPDGTIESQRLRFPATKRDKPYAEGELRERTWQYEAALLTMPPSGQPKGKYRNEAVRAMGWTWPAAAFSSMGLVISLVIWSTARVRRA